MPAEPHQISKKSIKEARNLKRERKRMLTSYLANEGKPKDKQKKYTPKLSSETFTSLLLGASTSAEKSESEKKPETVTVSIRGKEREDVASIQTNPVLQWTENPRQAITAKALRELLLCIFAGGKQPAFATVKNISSVVVLFIDSFGLHEFKQARGQMPFLVSMEEHSVVLRAPGTKHEISSFSSEMLSLPETQSKSNPSEPIPRMLNPEYLVLTAEELEANDYPGFVPDDTAFNKKWKKKDEAAITPEMRERAIPLPDYVTTRANGLKISGDARPRIVALDCEMCSTCIGLELARISMVEEDGSVLIDDFALPSNPILDYNTKFSGITEEILKDVKTTVCHLSSYLTCSTVYSVSFSSGTCQKMNLRPNLQPSSHVDPCRANES
jgi:hypothetical protein